MAAFYYIGLLAIVSFIVVTVAEIYEFFWGWRK